MELGLEPLDMEIDIGGKKRLFLFADMLQESKTYDIDVLGLTKLWSKDGKKQLLFAHIKGQIEETKGEFLVSCWRIVSDSKILAKDFKGLFKIRRENEDIHFTPIVSH